MKLYLILTLALLLSVCERRTVAKLEGDTVPRFVLSGSGRFGTVRVFGPEQERIADPFDRTYAIWETQSEKEGETGMKPVESYGAAAAGYGLILYGAWKFGEWTAAQPWNPLTHPAVPGDAYCQPRVIPFPKPQPKATPLIPPTPSKPGEIWRLKEKQGMFCTYECKDGVRFQTYTDAGDKYGNLSCRGCTSNRQITRQG